MNETASASDASCFTDDRFTVDRFTVDRFTVVSGSRALCGNLRVQVDRY